MSKYINKLPDDARQISNTMCWADRSGNIYGIETRRIKNDDNSYTLHKNYGKYFKYQTFVNKHNGYVYCTIKYIINQKDGIYENKQRRVHILVAETFLENPENFPIVGHKNNIKNDNRVDNLYWTTVKENTQKAFDDGLVKNDKGRDDSQSMPVVMFDTYTNKEIGRFGSVREAERITKISMATILRQSKYKKPVRKPFYFRFEDDDSIEPPVIVVQYDIYNHKEIGRYWNADEASRQTGISSSVIRTQCQNNEIPKWSKSKTYFLYSK